MDIKVICCDIDGTLVRDDKTLSEENIKWVQKAVFEKGIHFALVSGRPATGVLPLYEKLGITGPVSCFNGGTLLDEKLNVVCDMRLDKDIALRLCDAMDISDATMTIFDGMKWYLQSRSLFGYERKKNIYNCDCEVGPFRTLLQGFDTNKCVYLAEFKESIDKVEDFILKNIDLTRATYFREDCYLEVSSRSHNKGLAIAELSKLYNVPISQIMALGDADNDIEMLSEAGVSVVMANGTEKAKQAAKYNTASNNEDGVAKAIEKFVFGL